MSNLVRACFISKVELSEIIFRGLMIKIFVFLLTLLIVLGGGCRVVSGSVLFSLGLLTKVFLFLELLANLLKE